MRGGDALDGERENGGERPSRAAATERERRARVARALGVRIRVVDDLVRAVREEIGRALDVGAEPPPPSPGVATARCVVFDAAGTMVVSVESMSEYTLGSCLRLGSDALRSPARKSLAAYQACRALAHVPKEFGARKFERGFRAIILAERRSGGRAVRAARWDV